MMRRQKLLKRVQDKTQDEDETRHPLHVLSRSLFAEKYLCFIFCLKSTLSPIFLKEKISYQILTRLRMRQLCVDAFLQQSLIVTLFSNKTKDVFLKLDAREDAEKNLYRCRKPTTFPYDS